LASKKEPSGAAGRKQLDELTEALNYPWTPRGSKTYNREEAEALIDQEEIDRKRRLIADLDGTYRAEPDQWDEEDSKVVEAEKEKEETEEDEDEDEDTPPLPEPEAIRPIFQAVKTSSDSKTSGGLSEPARKDVYPGYYGQAQSGRSTAVQAIQWIPTGYRDSGELEGDILVAFARPSSNQASSYGALYVGQDLEIGEWLNVQNAKSFGKISATLGLFKFDEATIPYYLEAHKDKTVSYWIWQDPNISTNRDAGSIARVKSENAALLAKKMSDDAASREKNRKRPFKARPKNKT
jgi:hypothetical protein